MPARTISSLQNQRVKDAVKLRNRREREKQGRILIDGARELERAVSAGVELVEVFVCEPLCTCDEARRVAATLAGAALVPVTAEVFARLAFGQRAEGVLGVARKPHVELAHLQLRDQPLVAVLEAVEKPGNVGAVLRSADSTGVSAVIVAGGRTDLYNPNAIRASLGTIFTLSVCEAPTGQTLAWLRREGLRIFAARVDGAVRYTEASLDQPAAIVLGSEAEGLSRHWTAADITPIRLPMLGAADSLNLSAAAAVLFYEALRQRSH